MEKNEATNLVTASLFSSRTVLFITDFIPDLIHQFHGVLPFFHWGVFHTQNQRNTLISLISENFYTPVFLNWCKKSHLFGYPI